MNLLRSVVLFILINPLRWKNELVLHVSSGLYYSAFSSEESGNGPSSTVYGEHVGLDFIGH